MTRHTTAVHGSRFLHGLCHGMIHTMITTMDAAGRLVMQADGDLVIYDVGGRRAWSSNTPGNVGAYFALENDGNLVIYNAVGQRIWDRSR